MRFVKVLLAVGVLAAVVAPNAMAFRFEDSARNTPTGVVGQPYDHAVPTIGGCKGVEVKVLSGSLPPGLSVTGSKRDDVDGSNYRDWDKPFEARPDIAWETAMRAAGEGWYEVVEKATPGSLYKYRIAGRDSERFLSGMLARDIRACPPGLAQYTTWLDERGFVMRTTPRKAFTAGSNSPRAKWTSPLR